MYAYEDCQAEQEQGLSFVDSLIESTKEYLTPEVITTGTTQIGRASCRERV